MHTQCEMVKLAQNDLFIDARYHRLPPLSIVLSTLRVCLYECVSSCMSVHDGDVSAAPSYVIRVIAAVLV